MIFIHIALTSTTALRRFVISLLGILSFIGLISSVEAQQPRKVAVLVGVNQYSDPGIPSLRYAVNDVRLIGATLASHGWEVILLPKAGDAVSTQNVLAVLDEVSRRPQMESFLFYFCGHGYTNNARIGFLATSSTRLESLDSTALSLPLLIEKTSSIRAAKKSFFFDACRNFPGRLLSVTPQSMNRDLFSSFKTLSEKAAAAVFLSCAEGGVSFESDKLKNGVFTSSVLEGLAGSASVDGQVTSTSLMAYVLKRVPELESAQKPWVIMAGSAEEIFASGLTKTASKKAGEVAVEFDNQIIKELLNKKQLIKVDGRVVEPDSDGVIFVKPGKHTMSIVMENEGFRGTYEGTRLNYDTMKEYPVRYSYIIAESVSVSFEFTAGQPSESLALLVAGEIVEERGRRNHRWPKISVRVNDKEVKSKVTWSDRRL